MTVETDGSIVCPSAIPLVGMKPSIGLVSRTHVVPISHSQDTPGPMARSVRDVAVMLSAIVGADPADPATAAAVPRDFAAGLSAQALSGMRIAVRRPDMPRAVAARFDAALQVLRDADAILVPVTEPKVDGIGEAELVVLLTELKADLNAYLASTPLAVTARTLDQVIAFNRGAAGSGDAVEQELFAQAAATRGLDDPAYKAARAKSLTAARGAIDGMLREAHAHVLVEPSYGPAWLSDPVHGDQYNGPSASQWPAIAGYPHLTVPTGLVLACRWGCRSLRRGDLLMRTCCRPDMRMSSGRRRGSDRVMRPVSRRGAR